MTCLPLKTLKNSCGKIDKERFSKTISENARETSYNLFTHSFKSKDSNISESINTYFQYDFAVDTNFFTQKLKTFECLAFLSDGSKILEPKKIKMLPYFK